MAVTVDPVRAFAARAIKPRKPAKPTGWGGLGAGAAFAKKFKPGWSIPAQPMATPPPTAVAASGATAAAPTAAAARDPRDSGYYASVEDAAKGRDNAISALNRQDTYDSTDLNAQIRRLADQHTRDTRGASENANRSGLFYSSFLTKNLNDLRGSYGDATAATQENYRRAAAEREAQRGAERNAFESAVTRLLQEASDRQRQNDVGDTPPQAAAPVAHGPAGLGTPFTPPTKFGPIKMPDFTHGPFGRLGTKKRK